MIIQKTALVIGGSGGIGSAITERLLDDGFCVCVTYAHNATHAEAVKRKFENKPVSLHQMDLLDYQNTANTLARIVIDHPHIEVAVFTPTLQTPHTQVFQSEWEEFEAHFMVQVRGMWQIIRGLKEQIKAGNKTKFIVIVTEACIGKPPGGLSPYVTAKYGLMGFAKTMAVDLARYNCTVNMISPGMVETDLLKTVPPKLIEMAALQNPMKRIGKPEDVADAVSFLASDRAGYLNGTNITINGGGVML